MGRYGINWGESEDDLTKKDYDTIFTETNKIISEKNLETREIAIAYYSRGIIFRRRNDLKNAISDYTSAIELQNDYEPAWYNRGGIFYDLKLYDRALADFNQALKLKPTDEDIQKWISFLKKILEEN